MTVGGRAYAVGPPTVETVYVFIERFGLEAAALAKAAQTMPVSLDDAVSWFASSDGAASVLETCVDGVLPGDSEELAQLAVEVIRSCDIQAIAKQLDLAGGLDRIKREIEDPDPPQCPNDMFGILYAAQKFHVSPIDLMRWPYEAYIAAGLYIDDLRRAEKKAAQKRDDEGSSDFFSFPGVIDERS